MNREGDGMKSEHQTETKKREAILSHCPSYLSDSPIHVELDENLVRADAFPSGLSWTGSDREMEQRAVQRDRGAPTSRCGQPPTYCGLV